MIAVDLTWIDQAQALTEKIATPHRVVEVDAVKRAAGKDNPAVVMQLAYVEMANTGWRGPLYRFFCQFETVDGADHMFQVDLLPDLVVLRQTETNFQDLARELDS